MINITHFDWVPFYRALCTEISIIGDDAETRDYQLYLKAKETFQPEDPILLFEYVDPFSYIYALTQRKTKNQFVETFTKAKKCFGISPNLPTDQIFPTPTPHTKSLFYAKGQYVDNKATEIGNTVIWNLFNAVFNNKPVSEDDFRLVLSIKNVGVTKLTQVLFLINPLNFIPFETQMNSLPIPELNDLRNVVDRIGKEGYIAYKDAIGKLQKVFPGCAMYEVNLFNVLLNSTDTDQLRISRNYCQVSSWAEGQTDTDYFDEFVKFNAVWTGGPTGLTGAQEYPLTDFDRGDIVLVRRGTKRLGGIGIILENQYQPDGYDNKSIIKIIWLAKEDRKIVGTGLGQRIGFWGASDLTMSRFKELYPETFELIDQIRNKQRVMINHSLNKYKNLILQGPPGTGKTRLAKQVALWLTDAKPKDITLIEALDRKIFTEEPNIENISEIELIQFHPSYSYEDFVRGITTSADGEKLNYKVENKIFARIAMEAAKPGNLSKAYVLIIDEINRANLPSVLGELIYALEYRGQAVTTMYEFDKNNKITLPANLYIIGTMNTADRSVGHIDYAIRRRFSFIPVPPDVSVIIHPKAKNLFIKIQQLFKDFTSPDFNEEDVAIGHSYFLFSDEEIGMKLKYEIKPILLEYVKDGILLESAKTEILQLNV